MIRPGKHLHLDFVVILQGLHTEVIQLSPVAQRRQISHELPFLCPTAAVPYPAYDIFMTTVYADTPVDRIEARVLQLSHGPSPETEELPCLRRFERAVR